MGISYEYNGTIYEFSNIEHLNGYDYGVCITPPYYGRGAWLDDKGFQLEGSSAVIAKKMPEEPVIPYGYTLWGGQLRDALPHGRRWYMNGGRW